MIINFLFKLICKLLVTKVECNANFKKIGQSFDPNEWCLKNGLHSGGLNPGPLGHESSALTTRPRLLAKL